MVHPAFRPADAAGDDLVKRLDDAVDVSAVTGAGLDLVGNTPDEFAERLRTDLEKFGKIARSLDARRAPGEGIQYLSRRIHATTPSLTANVTSSALVFSRSCSIMRYL